MSDPLPPSLLRVLIVFASAVALVAPSGLSTASPMTASAHTGHKPLRRRAPPAHRNQWLNRISREMARAAHGTSNGAGTTTPTRPFAVPTSGQGPDDARHVVVVHVVEVTSASNGQAAVDRCRGPVEVLYASYGYPNAIVEHDYCGGAWFASLATGTRVRVVSGTQPGLYEVNGRRRVVPKGSTIAAMYGLGVLVLQTCRGDNLVFIGLSRA